MPPRQLESGVSPCKVFVGPVDDSSPLARIEYACSLLAIFAEHCWFILHDIIFLTVVSRMVKVPDAARHCLLINRETLVSGWALRFCSGCCGSDVDWQHDERMARVRAVQRALEKHMRFGRCT